MRAVDFIDCADLVERPMLAVVIDDMGPSRYTRRFIDLPRHLTLSFLPYAPHLADLTEAAHAGGHEVMLHMPMEPFAKKPREAFMISADTEAAAIEKTLAAALSGFTHVVGVNNHMGSKVTSNRAQMDAVMRVLKDRRLFFLNSLTSGRSVAAQAAQDAGLPNVTRDIFLDDQNDKRSPYERLLQAAARARSHGYAVAIGHPVAGTYTDLVRFLKNPAAKDVEIVPVAMVLQKKQCLQSVSVSGAGADAKAVEWTDRLFLAAVEREARDVDLLLGAVAQSLDNSARH